MLKHATLQCIYMYIAYFDITCTDIATKWACLYIPSQWHGDFLASVLFVFDIIRELLCFYREWGARIIWGTLRGRILFGSKIESHNSSSFFFASKGRAINCGKGGRIFLGSAKAKWVPKLFRVPIGGTEKIDNPTSQTNGPPPHKTR